MNELSKKDIVWAIFMVLVVLAATIVSNTATIADRVALGGWSPIDWVNHLILPDNFHADFPNGIEHYRHSLFMYIYPALYQWFDISPETTLYAVIMLEVLVFAAALGYLAHVLLPNANSVIPAISVLMVCASLLGMADLSRIAVKPFFVGLYYNVADASRLAAIAFALQRRWWPAGLLLAFSTSTHPIIGGLGAVFIAVLVFVRRGTLREKQFPVALAVYMLLTGAWIFGSIFQNAHVSGGQIPQEEWLAYTTAFNMHWFPFAFGTLTDMHGRHLLPLLGFTVLFYHFLPKARLATEIERAWCWGIGVLMSLVALGIAFTIWFPLPFLVKLNLTRASELVVWLGLPIVIMGLLTDLVLTSWWRRPAAGVLLVSPFLANSVAPSFLAIPGVPPFPSNAVVPILPVALLVLFPTFPSTRRWSRASSGERTGGVVALVIFLLIGWYCLFSGYLAGNYVYYMGTPLAWAGGLALAIAVWMIVSFRGEQATNHVILLVVAVAACFWVLNDYRAVMKDNEKATDYRAAQEWAKHNTSSDALFYVDPLIGYGWRDYSQRSSYGNLREWLHTSWLYDSNPANYREGMKRFAELGIDARPYLTLRPTTRISSTMYADVRQRFYALDDNWRLDIARRYGVSYFVMERRLMQKTDLPHVFENGHYVIIDVRSGKYED